MTPALFPRAAAHLTDVLLLAASSCTAAVYAILVGDLDPGFAEGVIVDNVCGEDRWVVEIPRDQRTPTVRTLDVSSERWSSRSRHHCRYRNQQQYASHKRSLLYSLATPVGLLTIFTMTTNSETVKR